MKPKIFIQLGRYGDIFNVLPLCWNHWKKTGEKPFLMVAQAYADVFEGVSYVVPVVFHGDWRELIPAIEVARGISDDITLCQIYGNGFESRKIATSFVRESWIQSAAEEPWGTLPLVFDTRDKEREQALIAPFTAPLVVLALDGMSSPFPYRKELWLTLLRDFGRSVAFCDVTSLRAPRIFDLLGLLEKAVCIITVDTGILHLAHACDTPVISLITSRPCGWHGSAWRPSHIGRFYYDEFPAIIPTVAKMLGEIVKKRDVRPRIIHTYADWRLGIRDDETQRRMKLAELTWEHEYAKGRWISAPFKQTLGKRDARTIGDDCPVPFAHDVIENGLMKARDGSDIIAITNADICFLPGLTGLVLDAVRRYGAAFTHRWDFTRLDKPLVHEAEIKAGRWYAGSDAFFFSFDWWSKFGHDLPDFVMGREKVDEVLRQLIKRNGGVEIPACIYHEKHDSYWEQPGVLGDNKGNIWNRELGAAWMAKYGYTPEDHRWWPAIPGNWRYSVDRSTR